MMLQKYYYGTGVEVGRYGCQINYRMLISFPSLKKMLNIGLTQEKFLVMVLEVQVQDPVAT
jgi:hypothetical protein